MNSALTRIGNFLNNNVCTIIYGSNIVRLILLAQIEVIILQLFLLHKLQMTTLKQHARQVLRRFIRIDTKSDKRALDTLAVDVEGQDLLRHRPYSEIPGPKPIPLLGNTWRFLPYIGTIKVFFGNR